MLFSNDIILISIFRHPSPNAESLHPPSPCPEARQFKLESQDILDKPDDNEHQESDKVIDSKDTTVMTSNLMDGIDEVSAVILCKTNKTPPYRCNTKEIESSSTINNCTNFTPVENTTGLDSSDERQRSLKNSSNLDQISDKSTKVTPNISPGSSLVKLRSPSLLDSPSNHHLTVHRVKSDQEPGNFEEIKTFPLGLMIILLLLRAHS